MIRTFRFAGITLVALALTGAIAVSVRVDADTAATGRSAEVVPDSARAGLEAASVEVEPVVWSRAETRRAEPAGARVDARLVGIDLVTAALLALFTVASRGHRSISTRVVTGCRRRAPPLLLSV